MRPSISGAAIEAIVELGLPERFTTALSQYSKKIIQELKPECVILYGSLAKDTYTTTSDIDLVVICQGLPEHFLDRLSLLQGLNDTSCSIDALGYSEEEFRKMLEQGHVTALDAVADGIALHGRHYFVQVRKTFQDMVDRGLHRSSCTWVLPKTPLATCSPILPKET